MFYTASVDGPVFNPDSSKKFLTFPIPTLNRQNCLHLILNLPIQNVLLNLKIFFCYPFCRWREYLLIHVNVSWHSPELDAIYTFRYCLLYAPRGYTSITIGRQMVSANFIKSRVVQNYAQNYYRAMQILEDSHQHRSIEESRKALDCPHWPCVMKPFNCFNGINVISTF